MIQRNVYLGALFFVIMSIISCNKEDKDDPSPASESKIGKFLIETTVKNPDGMSGASYLQVVPDLEGSLDNSNAIQLDFSVTVNTIDNDIFVFPSFGQASTQEVQKYNVSGQKLEKVGQLRMPPGVGAFNIVKINDEKAYISLYMLGVVWVINPKTMQKISEIDIKSYAYTDASPEPSFGFLRGDLYYLPLNQVGSDFMPYSDHVQCDVVIIDTRTDKVVKSIAEKASHLSFPTRPMFNEGMMFTDEQNDLYIACTGYFGVNPTNTKNGFVCIPNGKTDFDISKSWDISQTTIQGTNYKPASIFNCRYIGNGRVIAYVNIPELSVDNPYTDRNSMAVHIDLKTKTIKPIDVPLTDSHTVCIAPYNDLIILGAYGKEQAGFFTYDPVTEKTQHVLKTVGNPVYLHKFD